MEDTIQFWTVNRNPIQRVLVTVDVEENWVLDRRWWAYWYCGKLQQIMQSCRTDGNHSEKLHRLIMDPPQHMLIDHVDGDPANNRKVNLRVCTSRENGWNRSFTKASTSGFKGVSWNKEKKKWGSAIMVNRKQRHLGYFLTPEEASEAYCKAAKELHGEFARTK